MAVKMRRREREITDYRKIKEIMESCDCCRLGFRDGEGVYILPLNFGLAEEEGSFILYFHSAVKGKKLTLIQEQPHINFEMDTSHRLKEGAIACEYGYSYQSIMGSGDIFVVTDETEKTKALQCIMEHYTGKNNWDFNEAMRNSVVITKLVITDWTGKEVPGRTEVSNET